MFNYILILNFYINMERLTLVQNKTGWLQIINAKSAKFWRLEMGIFTNEKNAFILS